MGGLVVMAAAVPIASAIVLYGGLRQSTWLRIVVRADHPSPPDLLLAYGSAHDEALPIIWDSSAPSTVLGIHASEPARLLAIDTDRGAVPPALAQTWAPRWRRLADPPALLVDGPGIVDIAGTFQRVTLTFARGPGFVEVGWLDQHVRVDLSAGTAENQTVTLALPVAHRGWVLLPPTTISRMALRFGAHVGRVALEEVSLQGGTWEGWSAQSISASTAADAHTCHASMRDGALAIDVSQPAGCEVPIPLREALNHVSLLTWLSIWGLTAVSGGVVLYLLAAVATRVNRFTAAYELVETALGRWMREHTTWTRGRVLAVVLACTLLYHISYILSVPLHFNEDSLGYYAFGRNFLHTLDLASIATCRTPGYPGVIALSILVFGDQVSALVSAQHLALSLVGMLVVWFLYRRVGPLWAGLAGLLAGTCPILSIAASAVWTEALFAAFVMVALLVFLYEAEPGPLTLFSAGLLAGVATLIRPNGAVILALMVGWLFLKWWCDPSRRGQLLRLVTHAGLVVAGCALVTSFWVVHFHRVTGRWGLSDANCSLALQTRPVLAAGLQPTNIFQLAGFYNVISQDDAVATLPISQPYQVFLRYFPARHRYFAGRFLPWEIIYDDRYPGEIFRQYIRVFPARYMRQVLDALIFNLTHVASPHAAIFVYPDLEEVLKVQRRPPDSALQPWDSSQESLVRTSTIDWPQAEKMLTRMTAFRDDPAPPIRSLHLRLSAVAMTAWKWLALSGGLGALVCLLLPGYRRFALLAAHALTLSLGPAILGMGADRYAMVAEPSLYVLVALLLSSTLQYRPRRAPAAARQEMIGSIPNRGRTVVASPRVVHAIETVSVVVPVYNERDTFGVMMDQLLAKQIDGLSIEIVIVESNSTDGTRADVMGYQNHPRVRVVLQDEPRGKGHAVRTGLRHITGDYVIIQDADLEYDLDDYDSLLTPLRSGETAFTLGSRHTRGTGWQFRAFERRPMQSILLNMGHIFFTTLFNVLYGQRLRDPFTMYKVFRRDCLVGLEFECNRFDFDCELIGKLVRKGFVPLEIPVSYRSRSFANGKKISVWRDPPTWLWALLKYRFSKLGPPE